MELKEAMLDTASKQGLGRVKKSIQRTEGSRLEYGIWTWWPWRMAKGDRMLAESTSKPLHMPYNNAYPRRRIKLCTNKPGSEKRWTTLRCSHFMRAWLYLLKTGPAYNLK